MSKNFEVLTELELDSIFDCASARLLPARSARAEKAATAQVRDVDDRMPAAAAAATMSSPEPAPSKPIASEKAELVLTDEQLPSMGPRWQEAVKLVQRVFFPGSLQGPRTVAFCGVDRECDSDVCSLAAQALALRVPDAVCLVNAGGETRQLFEAFEAPRPGPVAIDVSLRDSGRRVAKNLWVLSAAAARLGDADTQDPRALLHRLQKEFSYVLFHLPPLTGSSAALAIGAAGDGVVLVLEANRTRRIAALSARQMLESANVKVLGAVLNNRTFPIPENVYRML